jgi:two-component system, cell cycle sensor histidine kinase and response regulator CckA
MVCALVSGVVLGEPVLADAGDLALFVAFGVLSPTLLQHARIMRRAADQADLAEGQAVGQLTGGLAHDFNNLLTVIAGYSKLALESSKVDRDDELRTEIQEISRAAGRATLLTQQLLAFSSGQHMTPEVLDLNTTVTDVARCSDGRSETTSRSRSSSSQSPGASWPIVPRSNKCWRTSRSTRATRCPQGAELSIATCNVDLTESWPTSADEPVSGSFLVLQVTDTGSGMDEATAAKAFEPFFTTKDVEEGTGLGLATVLGIVRQSGGHVHVESTLGEGTCIKIYLPETDREKAKPAPRRPCPLPSGTRQYCSSRTTSPSAASFATRSVGSGTPSPTPRHPTKHWAFTRAASAST